MGVPGRFRADSLRPGRSGSQGLFAEYARLYVAANKQGYTWAQGESLTDLEKTDRREEILRRERERRERLAARRRPRNLAQAFGFSELDDDGEDGCLICHL